MKRVTKHLYFWVLIAIFFGGFLGFVQPDIAVELKPLGDGFIALVKMLISPVIFCTVVLGIAGAGDMKKVGRVGGKALIYFEVVSTFALVIGLIVMTVIKPGSGFHIDPQTLDAKAVAKYASAAKEQSALDFLLHIIPKTVFDAFTGSGDLLQVLLVAILFGYAIMHLGKAGQTGSPLHRRVFAHLLRHDERRHEISAAGCRWRHGLHHRQIRHRRAETAGAADGKAGAPRLLEIRGRISRAFGLFVQPGRHQHLPDHGGAKHWSSGEQSVLFCCSGNFGCVFMSLADIIIWVAI